MTKGVKLAWGALSLWPLLYFIIFISFILSMMLGLGGMREPMQGEFPTPFIVIGVLHVLTMLVTLGLLALSVFHLMKYNVMDQTNKIIWVLVLFFLNMFAVPVYWYLYVWKEQGPGPKPIDVPKFGQ